MEKYITCIEELNKLKAEQNFSFIYFKNDKCTVCDSLLPQLKIKLTEWNQKVYIVDCFEYPDIAAQNLVLSVPALKVFYAGQELINMIRFVDLSKLEVDFNRIKSMLG
ncbi:MAG: thioredoxin family protein [Bacteroidales bacterium]|nr:thioredoxin family protein [Bacteroidales bacterium]MCK9499645.1 thioredoxin family protein [Bacteroidales bacterium]MDY0314845.1 thioredoxin family protein [Bacteroidales bacterium]